MRKLKQLFLPLLCILLLSLVIMTGAFMTVTETSEPVAAGAVVVMDSVPVATEGSVLTLFGEVNTANTDTFYLLVTGLILVTALVILLQIYRNRIAGANFTVVGSDLSGPLKYPMPS